MKYFKKIAALLIVASALFSSVAFAEDDITVNINGEKLIFTEADGIKPQIVNDRTMVPMRKIFEALGATVSWDESTQSIIANKENFVVMLQINNNLLFKNTDVVTLDAVPFIENDRTLVPCRAISESFGMTVTWDEATRTVDINN